MPTLTIQDAATGGVQATIQDVSTGVDATIGGSGGTAVTVQSPSSTGSGGGDAWSQTTQTSDYTATDNDSIWADASTAQVTVTLPSPSSAAQVRVVATDTTNGVTLAENGSEGINDQSGSNSTITMQTGESITVESDGSTWWVV